MTRVRAAIAVFAALPAVVRGAAAAGEDIRDIRGPRFVWPWWLLPAIAAGAVLIALIGWGLWRWIKSRRRPRVLLSHEIALQRLDEIRPLMQPATAREFSTAVSDVVRTYIERRFDVVATHRTTEEFLRDLLLTAKPSLLRHRALLSEFLHQCDLVKFAGITLTVQNMESLHHSARAFVLETAKPDPPTGNPAPGSPASGTATTAAENA
jgi:HAMP domain-containing protein